MLILLYSFSFIFLSYCSGGANLTFPLERRAKDDPFPGRTRSGGKVFLKNRLLDNLNSFFGSSAESLEMLDGKVSESNRIDEEPQMEDMTFGAKVTDIPSMKFGSGRGRSGSSFSSDETPRSAKIFRDDTSNDVRESVTRAPSNGFPTLIPRESITSSTVVTTTTTAKNRSVGKISSERTLDTIREWRRRLYKAFKGKGRKAPNMVTVTDETKPEKSSSEILHLHDSIPLVVDKNRQLIISRKEQNRQAQGSSTHTVATFGKDPNGRVVRLFGMENSGYRFDRMAGAPAQTPRNFEPSMSGGERDVRQAYRTGPDRKPVVYLPAPQAPVYHPPIASATPSPFNTLPPMITFPPVTQMSLLSEYAPQTNAPNYNNFPQPNYNTPPPPNYNNYPAPNYNTQLQYSVPPPPPQQQQYVQPAQVPNYNTPPQPNYNTPPQPNYNTPAPNYNNNERYVDDGDLQSEENGDEMFGPPVGMNNDCTGSCRPNAEGQVVSEEKCNSMRLRTIIQNHIVANDAESSKRAVQMAAEAETGTFFDAVCGTGFFSYIAHTEEFCLSSSMGVNCYVFSPVCNDVPGMPFGKTRKHSRSKHKTLLNRN